MSLVVDETLEGTGYEESWTEVSGAQVDPDFSSATAGVNAGLWGSQCLDVDAPASTQAYAYRDFTAQAVTYYSIDFKLVSNGFTVDNDAAEICTLWTAAGTAPVMITRWFRTGGSDIVIVFMLYDGSAHIAAILTPPIGQLVRLEVKWDSTADTWQVWQDGVSQANGTLTGAAAGWTVDRLTVGQTGAANQPARVRYDRIKIDNANRIGPETLPFSLDGAIAPGGAIIKQDQKKPSGSIASVGAIARQDQKGLAGSASSAGTCVRQSQKRPGGTVGPIGTLAKLLPRGFAGAIASSGVVSTILNPIIIAVRAAVELGRSFYHLVITGRSTYKPAARGQSNLRPTTDGRSTYELTEDV